MLISLIGDFFKAQSSKVDEAEDKKENKNSSKNVSYNERCNGIQNTLFMRVYYFVLSVESHCKIPFDVNIVHMYF
jgi:hypothetical protein